MKKLPVLLGVAAALLLPAAADAKKDKSERLAQMMSEPFLNAAPIATGVVQRLIINPHGEVDGLLLADGTLVKFPPHMGGELAAAVKAGDTVSVRGFREQGGNIKALIVTNDASKRAVVERPPQPGVEKMPKHLRFALLTRMQASGKVDRPLYGKKGEVNGVMLDDGTVIRFAKHAAYQFAVQLQPGQAIAVEGLGTQNEHGRALEAIAVGATAQSLQPIYGPAAGR